jgi:hypothetical protein
VPCTTGLPAQTPPGLLVWGGPGGDSDQVALLDPGTGRVEARYPEVHGVAGDLILWGGHERDAGPFTLTNRRTGARDPVRRPTPHGQAGVGQASPDGRLPGMPLITAVKFMSTAWTGDGRLVLAGDFDPFGKALAMWRPGQDHLAVKRLALPAFAGSDTFVPWPAPGD